MNIDYKGFCEGEQFEGGTAEGQTLVIGSGHFIPGFEDQLVGKNIGDEVEVNVTFPEEYHAENLKGKPATFQVKINSIRVKELPALDDEFAKMFPIAIRWKNTRLPCASAWKRPLKTARSAPLKTK